MKQKFNEEQNKARLNILKMLKYSRFDEGHKKLAVEALKRAFDDASCMENNSAYAYKNSVSKTDKMQAISFLKGKQYYKEQLQLLCDMADISPDDIIKNARIIWA